MDIEAFKSIPAIDKSKQNLKAKLIRKNHLNKKYFFGSNSPASKKAQRRLMLGAGSGSHVSHIPARPPTPLLREVQELIKTKLVKEWLVKFVQSPKYVTRNRSSRSYYEKSALNVRNTTAKDSSAPGRNKVVC